MINYVEVLNSFLDICNAISILLLSVCIHFTTQQNGDYLVPNCYLVFY